MSRTVHAFLTPRQYRQFCELRAQMQRRYTGATREPVSEGDVIREALARMHREFRERPPEGIVDPDQVDWLAG